MKMLKVKEKTLKASLDNIGRLIKEKGITVTNSFEKMDPDVFKKFLEQFPCFASTAANIVNNYKDSSDKIIEKDERRVSSYYDSCDQVISLCKIELDKGGFNAEERIKVLEIVKETAEKKSEKDTQSKEFDSNRSNEHLLLACGMILILFISIGGAIKINNEN